MLLWKVALNIPEPLLGSSLHYYDEINQIEKILFPGLSYKIFICGYKWLWPMKCYSEAAN